MKKIKKLHLGILFIATVISACSFYINASRSQVFSDQLYSSQQLNTALATSWAGYKHYYINQGRVYRPDQNYDTVSEGQGYALLRAVWMNDRQTFDSVWSWTNANLSRENNPDPTNRDHLFAWHYNGQVQDWTSATDADEDIAAALVLAGKEWQNPAYTNQAIAIINDIGKNDTIIASDGNTYITGGSYGKYQQTADINFSYLAPAYYKLFAEVTGDALWNAVVNSSYTLLQKATTGSLSTISGLFPNWAVLDPKTLILSPNSNSGRNTDYTYDAFRTPFRIAEDALWYNDSRANQILSGPIYQFFKNQVSTNGKIYGEYRHDGSILANYESSCIYGGDIAVAITNHNQDLISLMENKIMSDYSPNNGLSYFASSTTNYYGNNWAAFGLLMADGKIQIPPTASAVQHAAPSVTIAPTDTVTPAVSGSAGTVKDVTVNRSISINLTLNTTAIPGTTYLVDTEVKSSDGKLAGQVVTILTEKGSSVALTPTWVIPQGTAGGLYTVDIGIFSPDWKTEYAWNSQVASITI